MMPRPMLCMPCVAWFPPYYKPCPENLCSKREWFLMYLYSQIDSKSLPGGNNWSMKPCCVKISHELWFLIKAKDILFLWDPLILFQWDNNVCILTELQIVLMFGTSYHVRIHHQYHSKKYSIHLCLNYKEKDCCAISCASIWFLGILHYGFPCLCHAQLRIFTIPRNPLS